jgi:uncharacterized protein (TIGR04255 family)
MAEKLAKPPLVEAIFELRWDNPPADPLRPETAAYRLLPGRLYDRVKEKYPVAESLPTAALPDEMVNQSVQYRFRTAPEQWPLIQVGPGVLTLNETEGYDWPDFSNRCHELIGHLLEVKSGPSDLRPNDVRLRYLDAIEFDFATEDILHFLREKMNITVNFAESLFNIPDVQLSTAPSHLIFESAFQCNKPAGTAFLKLQLGQKRGQKALIWDTIVRSSGNDAPKLPTEFAAWLGSAHLITHEWFLRLTQGELYRSFQ